MDMKCCYYKNNSPALYEKFASHRVSYTELVWKGVILKDKLEKFGAEKKSSSQNSKQTSVEKLEIQTGELPDSYRKFLLHFGGSVVFNVSLIFKAAEPSPWADKGYDDLESLYGVEKTRKEITVFEAIDTYKTDFKNQWIPIGASSGGNQICLCLIGHMKGQIWFWDHESEPVFNESTVSQGLSKIAENFNEFIVKLEVDDSEPDITGVVSVDLDF